MATEEEQQEVVDTLKGPRYYRVQLYGYGGESAYLSIPKESYDFWQEVVEEHDENDLVEYMLNAEEGEFDFEDIDGIPENADFMKDSDGNYMPWYEHHNEIEHETAVTYDSATINIEEVDSDDYDAKFISKIVDGEDVPDFAERVAEELDLVGEKEIVQYSKAEEYPDVEYIVQLYSLEKGCFFGGVIETVGEFDPSQLKIFVSEGLNGEETISDLSYKNKEIENDGGLTNGKGYTAAIFKKY